MSLYQPDLSPSASSRGNGRFSAAVFPNGRKDSAATSKQNLSDYLPSEAAMRCWVKSPCRDHMLNQAVERAVVMRHGGITIRQTINLRRHSANFCF